MRIRLTIQSDCCDWLCDPMLHLTVFGRCRALSRWLLRAGDGGSIAPKRLRRLRGGVFGWKHKSGPVLLALTDVTPEQWAEWKAAEWTNVAALTLSTVAGFHLRVRVECEVKGGFVLADSSGRVTCAVPRGSGFESQFREAAATQGGVLLRHMRVAMTPERRLWVAMDGDGSIEPQDGLVFGFMAPVISDQVHDDESDLQC